MVKPLSLFSGALLAACMSLPAQADWYLDNESSRLSFISTKAGNLSEVHRFLTLHGRIDAKGAARLRVEMESVSTGIPVRDERLRSLLFSTKEFPDAHIMAQLNLAPITDLAPGAQLEISLPVQVEIRGRKHAYMAELLATSDGVGAALAVTRSHLDTAASMAWIVALVGSLLAIEYLLLEPIKRKVESWRAAA